MSLIIQSSATSATARRAVRAVFPSHSRVSRVSSRQTGRGSFCNGLAPKLVVCAAATEPDAPIHDTSAAMDFSTENGKLISTTEIAAFIQRDDIMDQMLRWAMIEAAEGGFRNFGLPMTVDAFYLGGVLWGFKIGIYKDGTKLTDLSINFDNLVTQKHEWIGRGSDGFPIFEGRSADILGKNIEIWKLDQQPVDEELRTTIRAFCNGFAAAMNRYYAFGSVFVDDAQ